MLVAMVSMKYLALRKYTEINFSLVTLQAFAQFDAEGDGTVDVENMLEALKNSSGANLQGELSHVIRQLQACSLVPGMRAECWKKGFPKPCPIEGLLLQ